MSGAAGGRIVLAATPLGNIGDASHRLREALAAADVIAAEDTRRLRRLLADLDVTTRAQVVSFYDAVERERSVRLVARASEGETIVIVTDAGMPSISDPGYRIVTEAIAAGVDLTAIPGPSAVLTAVALSGLPVDRFCFEGFLPRKAAERSARIADLADEPRTLVFFEAPHRLSAMLIDLAAVLGPDRQVAVCRELTKTYEEVRRGSLAELADWAADGVRGEITVVVAGADAEARARARGLTTPREWAAAVREREAAGLDRRAAMSEVAHAAGVSRRDVYDAVLSAKSEESAGGSAPSQLSADSGDTTGN